MSERKPMKLSHIGALVVGTIIIVWVVLTFVAFATSLIFKALEIAVVVVAAVFIWRFFTSRK